jgi:hypothetical protein
VEDTLCIKGVEDIKDFLSEDKDTLQKEVEDTKANK